MKLPTRVMIAGAKWKVVKEPWKSGARFSTNKQTIWMGTELKGYIFPMFIHELLEAICVMRDIRYQGNDDNDYLFNMNHKEFKGICYDLALALKDVVREGKK